MEWDRKKAENGTECTEWPILCWCAVKKLLTQRKRKQVMGGNNYNACFFLTFGMSDFNLTDNPSSARCYYRLCSTLALVDCNVWSSKEKCKSTWMSNQLVYVKLSHFSRPFHIKVLQIMLAAKSNVKLFPSCWCITSTAGCPFCHEPTLVTISQQWRWGIH